jgi:hypothetical protein
LGWTTAVQFLAEKGIFFALWQYSLISINLFLQNCYLFTCASFCPYNPIVSRMNLPTRAPTHSALYLNKGIAMHKGAVTQSIWWLGYGLDSWVLIPGRMGKGILLCHCIHTGSGTHPASYPVGIRGCSVGIKQLRCEIDHTLHVVLSLQMWCLYYVVLA